MRTGILLKSVVAMACIVGFSISYATGLACKSGETRYFPLICGEGHLTVSRPVTLCNATLEKGWVVARVSPRFGSHALGGTGGTLSIMPVQMPLILRDEIALDILSLATREFSQDNKAAGLILIDNAKRFLQSGMEERFIGVTLHAVLNPGALQPFCTGSMTGNACPHAAMSGAEILARCVLEGS